MLPAIPVLGVVGFCPKGPRVPLACANPDAQKRCTGRWGQHPGLVFDDEPDGVLQNDADTSAWRVGGSARTDTRLLSRVQHRSCQRSAAHREPVGSWRAHLF